MSTDEKDDRLSPEEAEQLIESIADVEREEASKLLEEKEE
jgi:hypothetical protein